MTPRHFQNVTNELEPECYQNITRHWCQKITKKLSGYTVYTRNHMWALYVILLNCGSSFVGIELYYNKVDWVYLPELLLTELSWELKIRGKNGY